MGWLREYMAHECAKSSLAFRKPAVAAASRRPARGAGLMAPRSASMALQASAPGELRGALGRLGYLCAGGGKAMFVAAADQSMLKRVKTPVSAADQPIVDRRTQWHPLSCH